MRKSMITVTALLALAALSACGEQKPAASSKDATDSSANTSAVAATAPETKNPCALLTANEAEAALGPLAGPPFRANENGTPNPNGDTCRFETAAFRAVDLQVEWNDGGRSFKIMNMVSGVVSNGGLKGVFKTQEGTTITGEWDEARLNNCCEFLALRGEQLVKIAFGASRATVEQAAKLADAAVQRLDKPLDIDATAGAKEAEAHAALRPKPRPVCELMTRAEVEAVTGATLSADPVGHIDDCTYVFVPAGSGLEQQIKLSVTWRGGFGEMRFAQAAMGQGIAFMKSQGLDTAQEQGNTPSLDEDATNIVGVMAVRKDVMFSAETGPIGSDVAHALIVKAASKL